MSRVRAVLFDIDGTLVDSVQDHVTAWWSAFRENGLSEPHSEIHCRIGKDGGLLVSELAGIAGADPEDEHISSALSSAHDELYRERVDGLTALPGARELVRARVPASAAVMIGDATWDFLAARPLGVRGFGLCSGGIGAAELREAGADDVCRDARDLLEHWPLRG